jgi:hypothetical protein
VHGYVGRGYEGEKVTSVQGRLFTVTLPRTIRIQVYTVTCQCCLSRCERIRRAGMSPVRASALPPTVHPNGSVRPTRGEAASSNVVTDSTDEILAECRELGQKIENVVTSNTVEVLARGAFAHLRPRRTFLVGQWFELDVPPMHDSVFP